MSDAGETRPEDRVRHIEQATETLEHDMDEAREAVHRARQADSLAASGAEQSVPEAAAEDGTKDETEEKV